jgi:hypothetical protein
MMPLKMSFCNLPLAIADFSATAHEVERSVATDLVGAPAA